MPNHESLPAKLYVYYIKTTFNGQSRDLNRYIYNDLQSEGPGFIIDVLCVSFNRADIEHYVQKEQQRISMIKYIDKGSLVVFKEQVDSFMHYCIEAINFSEQCEPGNWITLEMKSYHGACDFSSPIVKAYSTLRPINTPPSVEIISDEVFTLSFTMSYQIGPQYEWM